MADVTRICYYELSGEGGLIQYRQRSEEPFSGAGSEARIRDVARSGKLPGSTGKPAGPASLFGLLDIEAGNDEVCAYAFRLDTLDALGKPRLEFADPPFIDLPLNSSEGDQFVSEFRRYEEGGRGLWASFVCDLGAVRRSGLAQRVKKLPFDHSRVMKIPIWFNYVDPELGGSPWVVTSEDHLHGHAHDDGHGPGSFVRRLFTHGGVHPLVVANLVVAL